MRIKSDNRCNLIQYLALNEHSIHVSQVETYNNTNCKSVFQGSSTLRESNKNKTRVEREKAVRRHSMMIFSYYSTILYTHNDAKS